MSKITILGGGAVGSSFAAAFSKLKNHTVTLVGRKEHIEEINRKGLRLTGKFEETFNFRGCEKIESPLTDTLLMVTVKSVDLKSSLQEIAGFITPTTTILLTQNGWGIREEALEAVKGKLTEGNLFCGIVGMGANWTTPGEVECWGGNILVESEFTSTKWHSAFEQIFLDYSYTGNFKKAVWRKLIINSIVNPLSVLLNAANSEIAASESIIKEELLKEALNIAKAHNTELNLTIDKFNSFINSPNYTSMYQDVIRGRKTEVDFINGAIIKLGKEMGLKAPTHELIVKLIKAREEMNIIRKH